MNLADLPTDILYKIATSAYDPRGIVWFRLMRISDAFDRYAHSSVGIGEFIDFSYEIQEEIFDSRKKITHLLLGIIHRNHIDNLSARFVIMSDGKLICEQWYFNGKINSVNGNPAMISSDGIRVWCKNGKIHRDKDEPAIIYADGSKEWHINGLQHRDNDEPTTINSNGDRSWCRNGILHRYGDKPAIICANGVQVWYKNGLLHRDGDKPALINPVNGTQEWYKFGRLHRKKGLPCKVYADGRMVFCKNGRL